MRKLPIIIFLLLLVTPVLANPDFTPVIGDPTHYNLSYSLATNSATPFPLWLFVAMLGLTLLFASFVLKAEQGNDVCALIAPLPILITAWQSLSVDIAGGAGVAALSDGTTNTWVLLENHIIYSPVILAVFFGLLFIISLLNIYRVYLVSKTIEGGEQNPRLRT
jgi:hypothetical protein